MTYYSAFNEKAASKILEARRKGLPKSTSAAYAKVPRQTLDYWLKEGKKNKDPVLRKFYEDYLRVGAEYSMECIEKLDEKGEAAYIWKKLQAFNEEFIIRTEIDLNKDKIVDADLFNKDKMARNADEVRRERAKKEQEKKD